MKRKIYILFTAGIFAFAALLTFSCRNLIDAGDNSPKKNNSKEKAYLVLSIENQHERTIFASDNALSDMTYTIVGTKSGTNEVVTLASGMSYKNSKISKSDESNLEIASGTWDFTLAAYKGDLSLYSGTVSDKVIKSGENSLSFKLTEISDVNGTGNVSVKLKFSENSEIKKTEAGLYTLEQTLVTGTNKEIQTDKNSATYSQDIKNGIYILKFKFYTSDNTEIKPCYSEIVHVKAGRTSEATIDISSIGKILFENPSPTGTRQGDLNFIFNNQTLGTTTITAYRSEWNQLLKNFDYFYKNENCVHGISYEYEKDGYKWTIPNIGFRLRGNTSRFRPQGKDYPEDKNGNKKMNADWSQDYYTYAANCSDDDYRQSHFKVDFEEFLEGDDEFKMAGCMKGVALKRMDSSCTREIMCYDLFHKFGIWTAPYASHTRVIFKFIEDNGSVTEVDFGVYEMFEEVNKQSLKARDAENHDSSVTNFWGDNKGNLWKCSGGDLTKAEKFGVEQNEITAWDENGNPTDYVWEQPTYDLKTNKDDLEKAAKELTKFINELNALPTPANNEDTEAINKIKAFYENKFDVEFFLKTYAVNILVGMDDDYWGNANNYYLYFDTGKNGTKKVYFIPFDYDNTLGSSIQGNGVADNPLSWGRGNNRPLMDKLLLVPEYKTKFVDALKEVSSATGPWNYNDCSALFLKWKTMVAPYLNSPDLSDKICTKGWADGTGKPGGYHLASEPNLYDFTRTSFENWMTVVGDYTFDLNGGNIKGDTTNVIIPSLLKGELLSSLVETPTRADYVFAGWTKTKDGKDNKSKTSEEFNTVYARWIPISEIGEYAYIFEIEDDTYQGIKIGIVNVPENAAIRNVYVNDKHISNLGLQDNKPNQYVKNIEWEYPYTETGKTYKFEVQFQDVEYGNIGNKSNALSITATSGIGDFCIKNEPDWIVENNIIKFSPAPEIQVGDRSANPSDDWSEYYVCEFASVNEEFEWHAYESWNNIGTGGEIYVPNKINNDTKYTKYEKRIIFHVYLNIANDINGAYRIDVFDYNWSRTFKLTE